MRNLWSFYGLRFPNRFLFLLQVYFLFIVWLDSDGLGLGSRYSGFIISQTSFFICKANQTNQDVIHLLGPIFKINLDMSLFLQLIFETYSLMRQEIMCSHKILKIVLQLCLRSRVFFILYSTSNNWTVSVAFSCFRSCILDLHS